MKIKIKPYLLKLLKINSIYIFSLFFIIILNFIIIKSSLDKISKIDFNIKNLQNDIRILKNKAEFLQNILPNDQIIDEDIKLLNSLIPNIEDYFSIINALELLSQKTGFFINSYSVNVSSSTLEKLKLLITGEGDAQSFVNFLNEYNFGGGRLITADKIELTPEQIGNIKINLTFYNKKVSTSANKEIPKNTKIFQDLESIKKKITFNFRENTEENIDFSYPKKSNPF